MSNVIPFRARTVSFRAGSRAAHAEAVVAVAKGRCDPTRPGARNDLWKTVILLDLALQHARELAELITEERAQRMFERHLTSIAYSLQIARERMGAS
ncbi:hypothetical protein SSBR45G_24260 [Bradyrhizobium sp. SSBR45G]|uniref:hypothetical protein n=1 Tax=unclassified Bradyrhizobium TaxID=2631580 RepID=UPI0023429CE4|nr:MULTISPECIES: hypothetical protein [unclassified Bradyrhizobium]GLH77518.1 hypothetical protein SSBR45G_24260 [Bradyrhizobium sp. SSBR45G]GLH84376.1 hypothetical protein SSBR45R_18360 [Bradyrhizobium sp. SSBR45R]